MTFVAVEDIVRLCLKGGSVTLIMAKGPCYRQEGGADPASDSSDPDPTYQPLKKEGSESDPKKHRNCFKPTPKKNSLYFLDINIVEKIKTTFS